MKKLTDYITTQSIDNELEDTLFNILHEHINNEFFINYTAFYHIINEDRGHFSNYDELIYYIAYQGIFKNNKYKENKNYDILIDCQQFNTFFKKINLHVIADTHEYGAYLGTNNDIVDFEIHINNDLPNDSEISSLILHELMHAYEDINRIKRGEPSIFDYFSNEYYIASKKINSFFDSSRSIANCKYFLNDSERNAYFGQLEKDCAEILKQYDIKHFDFDDFKKNLKQSYIWKTYFECGKFVMQLNSLEDESEQQNIVKLYNKTYNTNITFNKLKSDLTKHWNKFYKKFNQLLPKIICNLLFERRKNKNVYIGEKFLSKYDKYKE